MNASPMKIRLTVAVLAFASLLAACSPSVPEEGVLRVGVTTGPHAEILEAVRAEAETAGLRIRIVEFTDYVQPNAALAAGDLDANSYQHLPYLQNTNASRGTRLVSIGNTFAAPIAIYSSRFPSLDALPDRAQVAIPNDPTNSARSLLVLAEAGAIGLREGVDVTASLADIVSNPKQLRFIELDAAQLPRSLPDVDAAAVNTNYALEAGLNPATDSIAREAVDSPYVNVLAVRAGDEDREDIRRLLAAYHSESVRRFIEERYQGSLIPAW